MKKKKIEDLVGENYVFAAVLHYFGIEFYNYSDKTLEQVCNEKGLNSQKVISQLESIESLSSEDLHLEQFPTELIIEYLKHAHHIFVKQRLPYIAGLIQSFEPEDIELALIAKDLKFVFPMFVQEFIYHLYEEEDTLFRYIHELNKSKTDYSVYSLLELNSIQKYAHDHHSHDDEMEGLKAITAHASNKITQDLHLKVIYAELEQLEKELKLHARIENEILFPKALQLERELALSVQKKVSLN
ncbi:MAG: iron-sulfur cluster repair di-iron protein [Cytophagales bacterium]|nr:iron-sulfur cluster repair di-iron protein [Cytophagales bacterium]